MSATFKDKETFFLKRSYVDKKATESGEIILYPLYACNCKEYIEIIVDEALEEEKEENLCCQLRGTLDDNYASTQYLHMNNHTYQILVEGYWNLWGQ